MSADDPETRPNASRARRIGRVLAFLVLAGGAVAGGYVFYGDRLSHLTEAAAEAPPPAPAKPISVTVAMADQRKLTETLLVSGSLVAEHEVMVGPEIDGLRVTEILAEENDRVAKGDVLARLDRSQLDIMLAQNDSSLAKADATIAQARASISEAEASEVEAKAALERTKALRTSGTATVENLMTREAASQVMTARVASSKEQLRLAEADRTLIQAQRRELQLRLARTEIKAPEAGIVSARTARLGAVVSSSNAEPLFRIIRGGAVELAAEVPEAALPRIGVGQAASVAPAGLSVPVVGKVRLVSASVDPVSRLGKVRIALDARAATLRPGTFARGVLDTANRSGVTVPLSAVLFGADGAYVQTVGDGGLIASRPVSTGIKADGRIEILDGLSEGETVVARAGSFLRAGDRVTPVLQTRTAGGPG